MGWWQHSAGLWHLSIFSRLGVDRMYTSKSPFPLESDVTQAILHTPRPREGREAWSTKVLPPSHSVGAQGAWL
jgi:hypothetical protein